MPSLSRVRRHLSFVEVIEGDVDSAKKCHCERSVMEQLAASAIPFDAVAISSEGCSFIINGRDEARFAAAIRDLNVAAKVHGHCARVVLTRTVIDRPLPPVRSVMEAFDAASIGIVHLNSDASSLTVLVDERNANRVVEVLSAFYAPPAARGVAPNLKSSSSAAVA
jgi:hypothetical protein